MYNGNNRGFSAEDSYEEYALLARKFRLDENLSEEESHFFSNLVELYGIKSLLDCGCGSGKHLFFFDRLGIRASGCDISPSMLELSRDFLKRKQSSIMVENCDFRLLGRVYSSRFDCVICISSLSHLENTVEVSRALSSMRDRISQGGILILELPAENLGKSMRDRIRLEYSDGNFTRTVAYHPFENHTEMSVLDVLHYPAERPFYRYDFRLLRIGEADLKELLLKNGFLKMTSFGDYDMSKYLPGESEKLIVVAER
ncbi:MAG: class I SAM-dependent methyltransferase [Ruminococcaceae bacterium]|nr:class I SAM-dependent methyltransferase [Oscillospiraceae bacterium]